MVITHFPIGLYFFLHAFIPSFNGPTIHSAHYPQLSVKAAILALHPAGCNLYPFPGSCVPGTCSAISYLLDSFLLSGLLQVSGNGTGPRDGSRQRIAYIRVKKLLVDCLSDSHMTVVRID